MSPILWVGLGLGVVLSVIYLCVAIKKKASPQLEHMAHFFFSAIGAMGAVRIVAFTTGGAFERLLKDEKVNTGPFAISEEDAVMLIVAALALAWITVKLVWRPFKELLDSAPKDSAEDSAKDAKKNQEQ